MFLQAFVVLLQITAFVYVIWALIVEPLMTRNRRY